MKKKTKNGVARRNQAIQAGWLDAQGAGEARTSVAKTVTALGRQRRLDGAAAVVTGKSRGRENEERRWRSLYSSAKKQAEATQGPFPVPARCHRRPRRARNAEEGRRPCSLGGEQLNYIIAIRLKFQITPKFVQQLKNLQK